MVYFTVMNYNNYTNHEDLWNDKDHLCWISEQTCCSDGYQSVVQWLM